MRSGPDRWLTASRCGSVRRARISLAVSRGRCGGLVAVSGGILSILDAGGRNCGSAAGVRGRVTVSERFDLSAGGVVAVGAALGIVTLLVGAQVRRDLRDRR